MTVIRKCNKYFTDSYPVITSKIAKKRQFRIEYINLPNLCIGNQRIQDMYVKTWHLNRLLMKVLLFNVKSEQFAN
jgi:lipid A disaccharide synthetase